jgi:hypothetical protein
MDCRLLAIRFHLQWRWRFLAVFAAIDPAPRLQCQKQSGLAPWFRGVFVLSQRGIGNECKENAAGANLEENVTARLLGNDVKAQDRPVSTLMAVSMIAWIFIFGSSLISAGEPPAPLGPDAFLRCAAD